MTTHHALPTADDFRALGGDFPAAPKSGFDSALRLLEDGGIERDLAAIARQAAVRGADLGEGWTGPAVAHLRY